MASRQSNRSARTVTRRCKAVGECGRIPRCLVLARQLPDPALARLAESAPDSRGYAAPLAELLTGVSEPIWENTE